MNRRTFVQSAAAFAAATQARPILGANDTVNLCVVGVGGREAVTTSSIFLTRLPNLRIARWWT
ncbi:MAG: hypothetical protein R2748_32635 [Bryobacterales bacterium]